MTFNIAASTLFLVALGLLYGLLGGFLLGVGRLPVPWQALLLSIAIYVALPLVVAGLGHQEIARRVRAALNQVGLLKKEKSHPLALSGGEQQRVAVARALGGSPAVMLADEPTGNLDSKNGDAVMELLAQLHQEGATICVVTHNEDYEQFAERKVHLFDGQIVS